MHEALLREAEKEQLDIVYLPLRGKLKGLYGNKVIAINSNIETIAEETCILAEELGHHYTTSGNILDQRKVENRKQERRARAWAYEKLVPLDSLIQAQKAAIRSLYELAEFLGVTEEFLIEALKYYQEKYGPYCQIGDYYIFFEPLRVFKHFRKAKRC